jgi:hypothetical protein
METIETNLKDDFDWLIVYYDLSSVQIRKALYKFLKSHWLHYNFDYVNKDSFLNWDKYC